MAENDLLFNPFEPGFTDDPYPAYRRLRDQEPVHRTLLGVWLLTSYEDVAAILRSDLSVDPSNVADTWYREQQDRLNADGDIMRGLTMLDRDPPDHTRLRSLVTKVFTPRSVAALEPLITGLVDDGLDRIQEAGRADLVEELAFPLPFAVISRMLGIPETDQARIRELSGWLVRTLEIIPDEETMQGIIRAAAEMTGIIRELTAWKRAHPADDLLSALIAAEQDGDKLSDDELIAQVSLLYIAGHETTVNLIANGAVALLRNPDQFELLRSRPEIAPNAVEEILRYDAPVQQSRRVTLAPYKVRDQEIPPGSLVLAGLAAANRDEAYWGPDANELRLDRPNARNHVSFGAGPHHCLGASLARLEGRVALERLVTRFPGLRFDGNVEWNGRINLRGPARLPVAI